MENYGSYQPQQINARYAQNSYVNKKEEEKEKIQKAVACTIGTLVGVGLASLVGYGIINKIGSKNSSVNKATEEIKQSAQKNIEKNEKVVEENIQNVIYRTLNKINSKKELNKNDIKEELFCLTSLTKNKMLPKAHLANINKYMIFLTELIKCFKDKETITKEEYEKIKDIYNTVNGFSKSSEDILSTVIMQDKVNTKLQEYGLNLTKINVSSTNKNTLVCDSNSCIFKDSSITDTTSLVLLVDNIYIKKVDYVKEDTKFYIKDNDKFYEATLKDIGEKLANVKSITDILKIDDITSFNKKDATVEKCKYSGTMGWYICGNFNTTATTATTAGASKKYVNIAELSNKPDKLKIVLEAFNEAKDFDSGAAGAAFANAVKESIKSEDLGKLLNDATLKGKLVDTSGDPIDAGKILITDWVENKDRKPEDIANVLKEISDFSVGSVGAAFANAVKDSIKSENLGQLLQKDDLKDTLKDTTKGLGEILIAKWVAEHNSKPDEIAKVLNAIKDFGDKTVGAAFAKEVAKLDAEKLGQVLDKANGDTELKDKLVDRTGKLTDAGTIMFEAASTKIFIGDFKEIAEKLKVQNFEQTSKPQAIKIESGILKYKPKSYLIDYFTRKMDTGETLNAFEKTLLFINAKDGSDGKDKVRDKSFTAADIATMINDKVDNDFAEYKPLDEINSYIYLVQTDTTSDYENIKFVAQAIDSENLGKLLNDATLKGKLVETGGTGDLTDAGKILIAGWVDQHKGNADEIANVLKEIKDFGDKSVGAAFAKEVAKLDAEKLGKLLDKANDYSDLKTQLQETTKGLGKILITNWVDQHKGNTDEIANVLKNIDNFDKDSVGEAFANAIWTNKDIYADTYLDLLQKDNLKDKLQDTDKGLGKIFISDKLKKKNISVVSYIIGNIDQKKCEKGEIGEVFLQKVIAKMSTEDIALVFTDTNFKLTDAGKKFITNWVDQHKGKPEDIAKVLIKFKDEFKDNSVGAAFAKEVVAKLDASNLGQLLNDNSLADKLVQTKTITSTMLGRKSEKKVDELTPAGQNFIKQLTYRLPKENWKTGEEQTKAYLCDASLIITNVAIDTSAKSNEKDPVVQIGKYKFKCRLDASSSTLYIRYAKNQKTKYEMHILPPPLTGTSGS